MYTYALENIYNFWFNVWIGSRYNTLIVYYMYIIYRWLATSFVRGQVCVYLTEQLFRDQEEVVF